MTRQILRFPVGPQFRRMLVDDHEWVVITDTRLKILAVSRGFEDMIPPQTEEETLTQLGVKNKPGEILEVYNLHTHPYVNPTRYDHIPSINDVDCFIQDIRYKKYQRYTRYGIMIAGHGVISKHGILIIKIPDSEKRLQELRESFGRRYLKQTKTNVKNALGVTRWDLAVKKSKTTMSSDEIRELNAKSHYKAFKSLVKEEPDIKTKTVRKNTFRTKVRR
jgi:hypothetical protein